MPIITEHLLILQTASRSSGLGCEGGHSRLPEIMVSCMSAITLTGRVGKAYAISDIISLSYFYPQGELAHGLSFSADAQNLPD